MVLGIDSSVSHKVPELDGWRGLAILMVLISHFVGGEFFGWMGTFGVQLFFVLSGFFMSNLLFIKHISLKQFFIRRFSRVYPAFFVATLAFYFYSSYKTVPYFVSYDELIATLTFFRTYYPTQVGIWSAEWPIGHYWSLNVEEHSYIYLALLVLVTRHLTIKCLAPLLLVVSTLATIAFMYYYSRLPQSGGSHWSLYSQCAAVGLLASAAYRVIFDRYYHSWLDISPWVTVICFCIAVGLSAPLMWSFSSTTLASLFLAISINHLMSAPTFVKWILALPILRWLGLMSFSLYLWQQPYFQMATEKNIWWPTLAIVSGIVSYYFVEKPMRKFINSRFATD
jgi:peptidoglycan/LPS O-acetylase OafA/YrhL